MSKEIIEQLKSNRVPYYLWTDAERAVADLIPRKWWLYLLKTGEPTNCDNQPEDLLGKDRCVTDIYRLKPDYEPEPESLWVETEITTSAGSYYGFIPGVGNASLHMLQSFVGFGGTLYEECKCGHLERSCGLGRFRTYPPHPCDDCGPHKPVKVRFWRQK